jgi:hypothetical protein
VEPVTEPAAVHEYDLAAVGTAYST